MTAFTEDKVPLDGAGSRIGPYELTREAGRGGVATVYEARDTRIGRRVAVKVVRLPSYLSAEQREETTHRLMREARAAGSLSHPNIVTMHDVGSEGDLLYLVMEFLDGETLHQRLGRGPMAPEEASKTADQLASALDAVHAAGMLHRDIKPGNVMILPGGRIKLMDFGIARQIDETILTQAGSFVGTPAYMSPEQCRGEDASAASDTWALGVLIYQMLAGRRPFEGATIPSVMYQVTHEDPPPIADLPAPIQKTVDRALDKDPERRFATPSMLASAFQGSLDAASEADTVAAEPETIWARTLPPHRSFKSWAALATGSRLKPWPTAAAAAALLGALSIGAAHLPRAAKPSPHRASLTLNKPTAAAPATRIAPTGGSVPPIVTSASMATRAAARATTIKPKHTVKRKAVKKAKAHGRHGKGKGHRGKGRHIHGNEAFFTLARQILGAYERG
ncbi:MAG: serine/threonine-protein kinase [Capsulimonas sp.]|uniref:serine/threonine-protein kinase n=1 Tax=Capsulimonas sp. TaxID=2494211 RepID=UPI003266F9A8